MLLGFSPVLSVFWATMLAIVVSALRSDTAIVPRVGGVAAARRASAIVVLRLFGLPISALITEYIWLLVFVPLGVVAVLGLAAPRRRAGRRSASCRP